MTPAFSIHRHPAFLTAFVATFLTGAVLTAFFAAFLAAAFLAARLQDQNGFSSHGLILIMEALGNALVASLFNFRRTAAMRKTRETLPDTSSGAAWKLRASPTVENRGQNRACEVRARKRPCDRPHREMKDDWFNPTVDFEALKREGA